MTSIVVGLTIWQWALIVIVVAVYLGIMLSLGWESHSKYGTGYWWVGACFLGCIIAYFNYRYWQTQLANEAVNYPIWLMIVVNFILVFAGLWAFLIFHAIFLKKSKALRSGSRLVSRVFAEDAAATGSGRFRDQLRGWEGDMRLDILIVEKKFEQAEDYLEGIIMKASSEQDTQKARHYEQYRSVIAKERIHAESAKEFDGDEKSKEELSKRSAKTQEVDIKRGEEIKEEELPEGWEIPD